MARKNLRNRILYTRTTQERGEWLDQRTEYLNMTISAYIEMLIMREQEKLMMEEE